MEASGLFLNRSFVEVVEESTRSSSEKHLTFLEVGNKGSKREKGTTPGLISPCPMTRSSSSSSKNTTSSSSSKPQNHSQLSSTMLPKQEDNGIMGTSQNIYCQPEQFPHPTASTTRTKNKRSLRFAEEVVNGVEYEGQARNYHSVQEREEDNNNNNNDYRITRKTTMSSPTTSSSSSPSFEGPVRETKKFKSKSGAIMEQTLKGEGAADEVEKTIMQIDDNNDDENNDKDEQKLSTLLSTSLISAASPSSPLSWKLPSFLCLPFTNNDANNSYLHLVKTRSKSSGILSLTSLLLVVIAVLLASVPAPVMSATATESGTITSSSLVTDEILNNDVTSHDYPGTTSSSITPVKLQTITNEGTTSEDTALLSSSATGRTTGGGTGPSVTHQSVEGLRQEPSMNDFAGWRDADSLTGHSIEVESSSDKGDLHDDSLLHKEYEFKSGYPELKNETREALQEEGSNHQPVVFVGGSGYVPPNSVRTRPALDSDPLWESRPVAESRYPVPLQSAWDRNYRNPFNMTRVQHIEAECQDDFMKIRVAFNGSFHGLIYSSGYSYDPDCVYVNGTGRDYYEYLIKLNRCGTLGASNQVEGRREPSKNFMWNTVTVQYNPMIEEEWDEHFKVTCEYGYDFWKTVTFPFLEVGVPTGNPVVFTLTPPECYMEVRYGFGTTGTRVGGPVRVGDPLTLMINMRSQYDGFDIVVNDCYAHNGATKRIQLIDHYGCPVDSKLMSPFRGTWSHSNLYETQVYAYLKTFRFTGSPALYIECDVRMCHGQCPSQPCYWRNVKSVAKRSADSQMMIADSEKNTTLSENLSLFQALRVLQEDEDTDAVKSNLDMNESVCMKTGAFTAMIALSTFILVVLTVSTMIMCFRIRRVKVIEERETAADILRPYSHHVSQPSQHRHHHWSSAKPR